MVFLKKKKRIPPQKIFFYLFSMQLFSADAMVFSNFFDPEKVKKRASKVAHNRPRPFYFTVQPKPQPTAQTSVLLSVHKTIVIVSVDK